MGTGSNCLETKEEGATKIGGAGPSIQTKKSETNPNIAAEDEFKKGKHGEASISWKGERRGLDHEADEGVGEDERDDPKQAGQPGEQPH